MFFLIKFKAQIIRIFVFFIACNKNKNKCIILPPSLPLLLRAPAWTRLLTMAVAKCKADWKSAHIYLAAAPPVTSSLGYFLSSPPCLLSCEVLHFRSLMLAKIGAEWMDG